MSYPCSICKEECEADCVSCDECQSWSHFSCLNIDPGFDFLENDHFSCPSCFSFHSCLERLESLKNQKEEFLHQARIERFCIENKPLPNFSQPESFQGYPVDSGSTNILMKFSTNHHQALRTTSDGNCLFHAVSTALFGNESMSLELRVRTALAMAFSSEIILSICPKYIEFISPSFDAALKDCCTLGNWSNAYTIASLSFVLGVDIRSVYPPINGMMDISHSLLNFVFSSPESNGVTIPIMWTGPSSGDELWTPNHFVPIVGKESSIRVVNCSDSDLCPEKSNEKPSGDSEVDNQSISCESGVTTNTVCDVVQTIGTPSDDLLSFPEMIKAFQKAKPSEIFAKIPRGKKENCFILMIDEENNKRLK